MSARRQYYFYPGIAIGFLAELYLATGWREDLDAAETSLDFATRCPDDKYCTGPSGTPGWGPWP